MKPFYCVECGENEVSSEDDLCDECWLSGDMEDDNSEDW